MKLKDINMLLNEIRLDAGAIWLENETIKLSTPEKLQTYETKEIILLNKNTITSILRENNIVTKEDFLNKIIWRANISASYPLSPAQERLWFVQKYEERTNA